VFHEFTAQVWTPSDPSVVITNNTDWSIDGSSKKIVWTDGEDEYATISFTAADLSSWEEISLYISMRDQLVAGDIFSITVDGNEYNFTRSEFRSGSWRHLLIDCSGMGTVSTVVITSLVANLTLFVDYIGYRKVTYTCDVDIIEALKDHINLDYAVTTYLSADVSAGDDSLSVQSKSYINDDCILQIDDGYGTIETVEVIDRDLTLKDSITNGFTSGDEVTVLCPVRSEEYDDLEPDPICGIHVYDVDAEKERTVQLMKNSSKVKEYLGSLGILVYIDCSSKKKLLQMSREFNRKYGREFEFLLDGELVDIYLENAVFADEIIGNNPRMAYYYRLEPQPYLFVNTVSMETITITVQSEPPI